MRTIARILPSQTGRVAAAVALLALAGGEAMAYDPSLIKDVAQCRQINVPAGQKSVAVFECLVKSMGEVLDIDRRMKAFQCVFLSIRGWGVQTDDFPAFDRNEPLSAGPRPVRCGKNVRVPIAVERGVCSEHYDAMRTAALRYEELMCTLGYWREPPEATAERTKYERSQSAFDRCVDDALKRSDLLTREIVAFYVINSFAKLRELNSEAVRRWKAHNVVDLYPALATACNMTEEGLQRTNPALLVSLHRRGLKCRAAEDREDFAQKLCKF
jgi:hypothetical protein